MTAPAYAFAHYGKSLFWDMSELLFAFYLAEIYGIDAAIMGLLVFVFLVWDAFTDPILGVILAKRDMSNRVLLSAQLFGAVLSSISFLAVFFKPDWDVAALTIYALLVGLIFRTAYTIYDVPQNALLKRLSHSQEGRLTLSTLRVAGGALSTITIGIATASILQSEITEHHSTGFSIAAILFATVALLSSALLFALRHKIGEDDHNHAALGLTDFKRTLLRSDLFVLFLAVFVLSVGWPLFSKLVPFFATYVMLSPEFTGTLIASMAIAALACQPIWWGLGRSVSRTSLIKGITILTLLAAVLFVAFGSTSKLTATLLVALMAAVSSAINMLIWVRLTDRLSEASETPINDILAVGTFTFSSKMGLGAGGLLLGGVLTMSGYEQGESLSDSGRQFLMLAMVIAPAFVTTIATGLIFRENRLRSAQPVPD